MSKTSRTFWTRPRAPLLLGAAACAACCVAPLVAIVLGATAATTAVAIFEPAARILMAASAVLAVALLVRRWRAARRCAKACALDRSCGCDPVKGSTLYTSPKPPPDAPIACTYDLSDRRAVQAHLDDYRAAFEHLVATDRALEGFTWRFDAQPGLDARLAALAAREHACCSFMKFELVTAGTQLHWKVQAAPEAQAVVEEFSRLPERLREQRGARQHLGDIKAAAARAGLVFTKDAAS